MRSMRLNLVGLLVGPIAFAARATPVLYPPPFAPYFPAIDVGGYASFTRADYNLSPPYNYQVGHHDSFISTPGGSGFHYDVSENGTSADGVSTFDRTTFVERSNAASALLPGYGSMENVYSNLSLQPTDGLTPFSLDGSLPIGTPVTIEITLRLTGTDSVAISGGGVGSVGGSASSSLIYDGVDVADLGFVVDPTVANATWDQSATAFVVGYVGYTTNFLDRVYGTVAASTSTDGTATGPESAGIEIDFLNDLSFSTAVSGVGLFSLSGAAYAEPKLVPEAPLLPLLALGGVLMVGSRRGAAYRQRADSRLQP